MVKPQQMHLGVEFGKFLDFLVSKRGIEMAPKQSIVVLHMRPPKNGKQIQALIGKLVALNMFISRYSYRLRPFFKALKGASSGE